MPKKDWEDIQADVTRKQEFEFIKEINLDKPSEIEKTEAVAEIPAEPDYDCPLCEFKGKGEVSLKVHKRMKHGYGKEK